MAVDWPGIPKEMLLLIAEKALNIGSLSDVTAIAAVCDGWKTVLRDEKGWLPRTVMALSRTFDNILPKLMLPERMANPAWDPNMRVYFDVDLDIYFRLYLPELRGSRCCGSGYGWLVMARDDDGMLALLNPLTRQQMQLPRTPFYRIDLSGVILPFEADFEADEDSEEDLMNLHMTKAIVICDPSWNENDYIVVAIISDHVFWLVNADNDKIWVKVPTIVRPTDIAYGGGVVYSFSQEDLPSVEAWNLSGRCFLWFQDWTDPVPWKVYNDNGHFKSYLVQDVDGGMYAVLRPLFLADRPLAVLKFSLFVFRFREDSVSWVRITNLGDSCLFVADNTSMSLSPVPRGSVFEKNHVYFARSFSPPENRGFDWCDYDVRKGTYERFSFVNARKYSHTASLWVAF